MVHVVGTSSARRRTSGTRRLARLLRNHFFSRDTFSRARTRTGEAEGGSETTAGGAAGALSSSFERRRGRRAVERQQNMRAVRDGPHRRRHASPPPAHRRNALMQDSHRRIAASLDDSVYPMERRIILLPPLSAAVAKRAANDDVAKKSCGAPPAVSAVYIRRHLRVENDFIHTLYEETDGHLHWASPKWAVLDEGKGVGNYAGITVDGDGFLRVLDLRRRRLRGVLPPTMCALSRLTELHLNWNHELVGALPRLPPALQVLRAIGCRGLTGLLPTLPLSLRVLNISGTRLVAVCTACFVPLLEDLNLEGCGGITGSLPLQLPLGLRTLNLRFCSGIGGTCARCLRCSVRVSVWLSVRWVGCAYVRCVGLM